MPRALSCRSRRGKRLRAARAIRGPASRSGSWRRIAQFDNRDAGKTIGHAHLLALAGGLAADALTAEGRQVGGYQAPRLDRSSRAGVRGRQDEPNRMNPDAQGARPFGQAIKAPHSDRDAQVPIAVQCGCPLRPPPVRSLPRRSRRPGRGGRGLVRRARRCRRRRNRYRIPIPRSCGERSRQGRRRCGTAEPAAATLQGRFCPISPLSPRGQLAKGQQRPVCSSRGLSTAQSGFGRLNR
jgi:hypothetical protein